MGGLGRAACLIRPLHVSDDENGAAQDSEATEPEPNGPIDQTQWGQMALQFAMTSLNLPGASTGDALTQVPTAMPSCAVV